MHNFSTVQLISVFFYRAFRTCLCIYTFFALYITYHARKKSAVHYLVYLDIWLLLFRSAPTQILLIALTNTESPMCHKSKQDTVVAPSEKANLNESASVNSGTENPYVFSVCSLVCCTLPDIALSCGWHRVMWSNLCTEPAGWKEHPADTINFKAV